MTPDDHRDPGGPGAPSPPSGGVPAVGATRQAAVRAAAGPADGPGRPTPASASGPAPASGPGPGPGPGRRQVLLRLDPAVHDAVARWAADDLRSVNAQIEVLLRRALVEAGRGPRGAGPLPRRGRPPRSAPPETTSPPVVDDDPVGPGVTEGSEGPQGSTLNT